MFSLQSWISPLIPYQATPSSKRKRHSNDDGQEATLVDTGSGDVEMPKRKKDKKKKHRDIQSSADGDLSTSITSSHNLPMNGTLLTDELTRQKKKKKKRKHLTVHEDATGAASPGPDASSLAERPYTDATSFISSLAGRLHSEAGM
jgi:hypothetical protein